MRDCTTTGLPRDKAMLRKRGERALSPRSITAVALMFYLILHNLIASEQSLSSRYLYFSESFDAKNVLATNTLDSSYSYQNNNVGLSLAETCTEDQRQKIVHQLLFEDDANFDNTNQSHYGRFLVHFEFSKCPETTWINELYASSNDPKNVADTNNVVSDTFLGISIGCNKGFDAIKTARMGLADDVFDVTKWKHATLFAEKGVCRQDTTDEQALIASETRSRTGEMHCVEPVPSTFGQLKKASDELNFEAHGFVLTHAAVSAADSTIPFPKGLDGSGRENFGLHSCTTSIDGGASKTKKVVDCEDVAVYSLDNYVNKFVQSKGPVNILQIDVEGWDFNVLFGASSVLDRTQYLEFEFHSDGNWNNLHLPDAVRLLDAKGFTCYWAGRGRLWRITQCYFKIYNYWHGWSNVACVHRSQTVLAEKMEKVFHNTLELW